MPSATRLPDRVDAVLIAASAVSTARYIDAVNQSLIQSTLIFRKPFKGFRRKYTSNKGVDDLLKRKYV
jgi:hypothetical protein